MMGTSTSENASVVRTPFDLLYKKRQKKEQGEIGRVEAGRHGGLEQPGIGT